MSLVVAKRGARNHPAADVLAGVDANWPFPRFRLTDERWREVAKLSEIPEREHDARHHIETTLGMFRQFEASELERVTPAKIRQELEALADVARNLESRLSKLVEERDAFTALAGGPNVYSPLDRLTDLESEHLPSSLEGQRRVSDVLQVLLRLPKWLLVAAHRIKAKRGPKAGNIYWLVSNLDGIREQFTGKKITRSYKDDASKKYITYVCRIADPHIGGGTIDKAMKARIKKRRVD